MALNNTRVVVPVLRYRCSYAAGRPRLRTMTPNNLHRSIFAATRVHARCLSSQAQHELNSFVWDWFSTFLARKLNQITSFLPPPPGPAPKNTLVVHCHPSNDSFSAHLLEACVKTLRARGGSVNTVRLYGQDKQQQYQPAMGEGEWKDYAKGLSSTQIDSLTREHLTLLKDADALVFVYPTWWFGQPAMLKGWLERVLLPQEAFKLGEDRFKSSVLGLAPAMTNIKRIAVVTTYGNPWIAVRYVGDPGRRLFARGIRLLCNRDCTVLWLPFYSIDESSESQRKLFVDKVQRAMQHF